MDPSYNLGIFFVLLATFYFQNVGFLMVNQDKWNIKPIISNIRWKRGVRNFIHCKWLISLVAGIHKITSCSMLPHHLLIFGCGEPWDEWKTVHFVLHTCITREKLGVILWCMYVTCSQDEFIEAALVIYQVIIQLKKLGNFKFDNFQLAIVETCDWKF